MADVGDDLVPTDAYLRMRSVEGRGHVKNMVLIQHWANEEFQGLCT
jgi:hypothetical protein